MATRPKHCFARYHMPAAIESFHGYALAASRKSGIFYSDARRDAGQFVSNKPNKKVSKNTITAWTQRLDKEGWFERIDKGRKRNPVTGEYASIRYHVLSHDEWAAKYPGHCLEDSEDAQSQSLGQAPVPVQSQLADSTCPNLDVPPVPVIGTKTVKKDRKERQKRETE